MKKFETTYATAPSLHSFHQQANELGQAGWELVSTHHGTILNPTTTTHHVLAEWVGFFKREVHHHEDRIPLSGVEVEIILGHE